MIFVFIYFHVKILLFMISCSFSLYINGVITFYTAKTQAIRTPYCLTWSHKKADI